MSKNTKSTAESTTKTTVTKTKVQKTSPIREAYKIFVAEMKAASDAKKTRKSEMLKKIDAMWKEYQSYTKNEYKTARKAAIDKFNAVKAEAKAKRSEKKVEKPATKTAKKVVKTAEPKSEVKAETPVVEAK